MSEELIYKVAWEINIKQEEIMEEIVDLKDLMVDNNSKTDALLKILKENAVEMAKISVAPKEDYNTWIISKLFSNSMQEYKNEKLQLLNKVGLTKFRSNYLGPGTQRKLEQILGAKEEGVVRKRVVKRKPTNNNIYG